MNPERKLVLLPIDGSAQSMEVVRYVSRAVNLADTEVVFLSIIDKAPDAFWETGKDQKAIEHLEHMKNWNSYREQRMRDCMGDACKVLEKAGMPPVSMTCNVQKMSAGIARDILDECKFGYNAVAIGRNGLGQMDEALLGSIAAKVFINVVEAPVCLLGGKPKPGKILVGLDNSLCAVRAVDFVGNMLNVDEPEVCLAHLVRIPQTSSGRPLDEKNVAQIVREHEDSMKPVFDSALRSLVAAGIPASHVTSKLMKVSGSRAVNLFSEAKSGRFGTIVIGRKGLKDVDEFTMGRMPYKLGQIAKSVALWLVP
ncbi:MAG: universal stress protein [Desulfobacteraceae bacterium]|nr:universal stress protein [Desulfobacteraceae bacterium]